MIRRIRQRREHAIVQKSGASVAVLLPMGEYEQLLRYRRLILFDRLTRELGERVERSGLSENELMAELEKTNQEVVREKYARVT